MKQMLAVVATLFAVAAMFLVDVQPVDAGVRARANARARATRVRSNGVEVNVFQQNQRGFFRPRRQGPTIRINVSENDVRDFRDNVNVFVVNSVERQRHHADNVRNEVFFSSGFSTRRHPGSLQVFIADRYSTSYDPARLRQLALTHCP